MNMKRNFIKVLKKIPSVVVLALVGCMVMGNPRVVEAGVGQITGVVMQILEDLGITSGGAYTAPSSITDGSATGDLAYWDGDSWEPIPGGEVQYDGTSLTIDHTATENDDHAFEIDVDAAGFGDVKALDVVYVTGATASGEEEEAVLINIDESSATGGTISAMEVLATDFGAADNVYGLLHGVGVSPLLHQSGTFGDADNVDDNGSDETTALSGGGGGSVSVFEADHEYMIIGDAAEFYEIEFNVATAASGSGIAPTFEFSTGVGTWTAFSPADGTNGMKNTGVIAWLDGDISTWATGAGSEYLIRVTRTRNTLSTAPILDQVSIAAPTEFSWDASGNVSVNNVLPTGYIELDQIADPGPPSLNTQMRIWMESGDSFAFADTSNTRYLTPTGTAIRFGTTAGGRDCIISGSYFSPSLGSDLEDNTAVAASPNALQLSESGKTFTNIGATAENHHNLPSLDSVNDTSTVYTFIVSDADGMQINAQGNDTISIGGSTSGAAGDISTTTTGSVVTLKAISATEWVAISSTGTWVVN